MTLDNFQKHQSVQKELDIIDESLVEIFKFYVLFSDISKLAFFEYNYELNNFTYAFSVDSKDKISEDLDNSAIYDSNYSLILEEKSATYGMITFDENPGTLDILNELFDKAKNILKKKFEIKKQLLEQESTLDIFIIKDESSNHFANQLKDNLNIQLNVNISIETSVSHISDKLKDKIKKSILIYAIDDITLLKEDQKELELLNEVVIIIGPNDYDLSLFCGHLGVQKYISKDEFTPEQLKNVIIQYKGTLYNKYQNKNKIIAIAGISGGIGTTTTAMNMANLIALKKPEENVLYIDLSKTKAISNLFLSHNPLPKKTIIDLINSNEFDIEKNLQNGLEKVRENFFSINGIQKHIDNEYLEQDHFIGKLLEYISVISLKFNYIIIDAAQADASKLNSTIYDIANELWILTEMSLPQISKLKTFFSLMKRAGLKDKLSFIANRYDSDNAISVSDVMSILNTTNEDHLNFNLKLPNDYESLGYCWNYCELVTSTHKKSPYVKTLTNILVEQNLLKVQNNKKSTNGSLLNMLFKKSSS